MSTLCAHCHGVVLRGQRCPCPGANAYRYRRGPSGWARQKANRQLIVSRGGVCEACRKSAAVVVDHMLPLVHGGDDSDENKSVLCEPCHVLVTRDQFGYQGGGRPRRLRRPGKLE